MAKRVIDDATLTAIADEIRLNSGGTIDPSSKFLPSEMPVLISEVVSQAFTTGEQQGWENGHIEGYNNGYSEGYDEGYEAGLAADRNLFDWDTASFYATNAYSAKPTRFPTYEDGVWYSGGIYGDTMGYYTCIPVQAGDIITFSADLNVTGINLNYQLVVGTNPVDDIFSAYTALVNKLENPPVPGTKVFAVQIPEGYEWFGFSFVSNSKKQAELRNIVITRQNNALGEQAAAYNILTGVAE